MNIIRTILVISVFLFTLFFMPCSAQVKNPKDYLENKELEVSKLVIGGLNRSDRLGKVVLEDNKWIEYDRDNKLIATAEIKQFTNSKIKVKWITAKHGAEEGAVTTYFYSVMPKKVLFNIKFDRKIRGFFEVPI